MAESNMSLFAAQFHGDYALEVRIIRAASMKRAIEMATAVFADMNRDLGADDDPVFSTFYVTRLIVEGEEKTVIVDRYIE